MCQGSPSVGCQWADMKGSRKTKELWTSCHVLNKWKATWTAGTFFSGVYYLNDVYGGSTSDCVAVGNDYTMNTPTALYTTDNATIQTHKTTISFSDVADAFQNQ